MHSIYLKQPVVGKHGRLKIEDILISGNIFAMMIEGSVIVTWIQ
jgi:hypothetical protein